MMGGNASESAYRVLMGVLESRTGQTLSPNRIWRIEMSLKPVMQRHGIADLDALVAALVTSNSRQLLDDTVAIHRLSVRRDSDGVLRIHRIYDFEYSDTGNDRTSGSVVLLGKRVLVINLNLKRTPHLQLLH